MQKKYIGNFSKIEKDFRMDFANEPIFQYLSVYAYQPWVIYSLVILMMYLSSFGLPLPEEVTLLSAGFIAFMGSRPDLFPPPDGAGAAVDPYVLAFVASFAVASSDFLIYFIGRIWGSKALETKLSRRFINPARQEKIEKFTKKYGALAVGIFRFTPGLRFAGHLLCGAFKLPSWKFIIVDSFAVLISVPTQILLIAFYGEEIFGFLKTFKLVIFSVLGVVGIFYFLRKWKQSPELKA
jgi:membrane protein DedA with SNARE-associated domain